MAQKLYPDLRKTAPNEVPLLLRAMAHAISHARVITDGNDFLYNGYALVPFAEFINHSEVPNAEYSDLATYGRLGEMFPSVLTTFELRTAQGVIKRGLNAGDEVTYSYG